MKRSVINASITWAKELFNQNKISLPEFAYWSKEDWLKTQIDASTVKHLMLGWDVTDFGSGRFDEIGGVLFTLRNGDVNNNTIGTPYAEKYIIVKAGQRLPMHQHKMKTEDIINRSGGIFCIQLYNTTGKDTLDAKSDVIYFGDGIKKTVPAGTIVEIKNGQSITLTPGMYHSFWGKDKPVVIGEVSSINDDNTDNYFIDGGPRFSAIEEDEPPKYLLCNEYNKI